MVYEKLFPNRYLHHSVIDFIVVLSHVACLWMTSVLYEPRRKKTGLRGFQPGLTQTELKKMARSLKFRI